MHHIALRLPDDAAQAEWRKSLLARGLQVSPITDRNDFHSIYFRGPEGVLYELATDPPGMMIDETPESLGTTLRLPPQYEKHRAELERVLAPLESPFAAPNDRSGSIGHSHSKTGPSLAHHVGLRGLGSGPK